MRLKPTIVTFLTVLSLFFGCLHAQENAGQAGEFLRWGAGTKALSLGRAFTAISDDASALYWNPAGLSSLTTSGGAFMFMHVPMKEGASLNYLAGAIPMRLFFTKTSPQNRVVRLLQDFKFGLGILWHSLGEFEIYDDIGRLEPQAANSVLESALYFSVSYPLNGMIEKLGLGSWKSALEIGLTSKFIRQDLFGADGTATGFDLGLRYAHHSGMFSLGMTLHDFSQASLSYNENIDGDKIPATAILGVSLQPKFWRFRGLTVAFDYGIIQPSARRRDLMFGAEYDLSFINSDIPLKLRVGMNSNHESFTIGLNFSPELLLGQDWVPQGDVSYLNSKSALNATGTSYTISIDRNPFTAKYWYERGIAEFYSPHCQNSDGMSGSLLAQRYFENALKAENPGPRAYRFDAALRIADFEFFSGLDKIRNSDRDKKIGISPSGNHFRNIASGYEEKSSTYLLEDSGKKEIDAEAYFNSFVYYVQSLILSGASKKAAMACVEKGLSWGKRINILDEGTNRKWYPDRVELLSYLHAIALSEDDQFEQAEKVLRSLGNKSSTTKFFLAHLTFFAKDYTAVVEILNDVDLNDTIFPDRIFLPLTRDCTFGDEILFLKAAALYKIARGNGTTDYVAEFVKIPRFFPDSDLAKFLTNDQAILPQMISYYEIGDRVKLRSLIDRIIETYLTTFSTSTLKEKAYTYRYK